MESGKIFKLIWRGWFVGATVFFMPMFILFFILHPEAPRSAVASVLLIPLITWIQGIFLACIVLLGLKIWPIKKQP